MNLQEIFSALSNINIYHSLSNNSHLLLKMALFTILLVIYLGFSYYFAKFICKRDLLKLNLNQYNRVKHPQLAKILETILYILEYMIILPFVAILWFTVFALILIMVTKEDSISNALFLAAVLVACVRICAYFKEDIAETIANLVPMTIVVLIISEFTVLNSNLFLNKVQQIPTFTEPIIYYFVFVFVLEILLRLGFVIYTSFKSKKK